MREPSAVTAGPCSALAGAFRHRHEAEMAAGFLEDAGIEAAVIVEDAGGAYAGLVMSPSPARVLVRPEEARRAREVLREVGLRERGAGGDGEKEGE